MLKISLLALAVFCTCQVDGGKLPTNTRFQRQEVLDSAPYPPSGFRPEGTGFELPNENELPLASEEQFESDSGIETFNRLKSAVKSEKLVQPQATQLKTNVASVSSLQPLNYVQPTSPIFAKIQAVPVQPQITPFNYATYQQQALLQSQYQQANSQPSQVQVQPTQQFTNQQLSGQVQPVPVFNTQQPEVFGAQPSQMQLTQQFSNQQLSGQVNPVQLFNNQQPAVFGSQVEQQIISQPSQVLQDQQLSNQQVQSVPVYNTQQSTVFGAQVEQPFVYSGQLQQPTIYGAQLQQSATYAAQLQQPALYNGELLQNYW